MRRPGWFLVAAVLLVTAIAGCGAVPGTGSDASSSRTASPPPSPSPMALLVPGDCAGTLPSLGSTTTKSLGMDSITLKIPQGWSDRTSEMTRAAVLVRVQAPTTYGPDNATFTLVAIPGPKKGSSAHEQATEDAAGRASLGAQSAVNDCTIGSEIATFYSYRDSQGLDIYRLLILRSPTSRYPF